MLHTINKSPFGSNSFRTSVRFIQSGDPILFLEDGVYCVQANNKFSNTIEDILKINPVYALDPDLDARGISEITKGVFTIDYEGFVELVEKHQVNSWL
tara:strand:- start:288 stop:581 length:294 start_codon:yes stop_codon:yes gene_type:complete